MGEEWTDEDVERRKEAVRRELLDFLKSEQRLEAFRRKERWRLMRLYVWPGAPANFRRTLEEAVGSSPGVESVMRHLESHKKRITAAIEAFNFAVRRQEEERLGRAVSSFTPEEREQLRNRQITFEGVRTELLHRSRELADKSTPDLLGGLLPLRLGVLNHELRHQIFREVSSERANEVAMEMNLSGAERDVLAFELETRLRLLDRYHIAKHLARTYNEARTLLRLDEILEALREEREGSDEEDPMRPRRIEALKEAASRAVGFLEELWPTSKETHDQTLRRIAGGTSE